MCKSVLYIYVFFICGYCKRAIFSLYSSWRMYWEILPQQSYKLHNWIPLSFSTTQEKSTRTQFIVVLVDFYGMGGAAHLTWWGNQICAPSTGILIRQEMAKPFYQEQNGLAYQVSILMISSWKSWPVWGIHYFTPNVLGCLCGYVTFHFLSFPGLSARASNSVKKRKCIFPPKFFLFLNKHVFCMCNTKLLL